MRLLPLQQVEEALLRRLSSAGSSEIEATRLLPVTDLPCFGTAANGKEITVNSTSQWKFAFSRLLSNPRSSFDSGADIDFEDPNDPGVILHACAEDMIQLWNDPTIKALLSARKQRLEDMAGLCVIPSAQYTLHIITPQFPRFPGTSDITPICANGW